MEGMKDTRPDSASKQRPDSGRDRPESASRARTDSIVSIEVCVQGQMICFTWCAVVELYVVLCPFLLHL